jgi:hypothetical protein
MIVPMLNPRMPKMILKKPMSKGSNPCGRDAWGGEIPNEGRQTD